MRFLAGARYLAATPLIGTAMAQTPFQVKAVSKLKGSAKSVIIPTHEFAGPNGAPWIEERLDFPASWDLHVMDMAGHNKPALTPQQIAEQSSQPIGSKSLRELAEGKKTVAISFDDLTRTTPAYAVTPWLMAELTKAGIKDENVLFIGSFGTHRAMTQEEVGRKLGAEVAKRYAWLNHDAFDNLKEVGTTTRENKVLLNQTFLAADLKICISGVKVHQDAGYGGGAKAILPGLAGLQDGRVQPYPDPDQGPHHRPGQDLQERHAAGHDRGRPHGQGGLHGPDPVQRPPAPDADLGRRHRRGAPCGCAGWPPRPTARRR